MSMPIPVGQRTPFDDVQISGYRFVVDRRSDDDRITVFFVDNLSRSPFPRGWTVGIALTIRSRHADSARTKIKWMAVRHWCNPYYGKNKISLVRALH